MNDMKMPVELRGRKRIKEYAGRYLAAGQWAKRDRELKDIFKEVRKRGYMLPRELMVMGEWKAERRILHHLRKNSREKLKQVTGTVLAGGSDRERMHWLRQLRGVGFPVASVFLHFGLPGCYPILDVRAVRTVGGPAHIKSYRCWLPYAKFCRTEAKKIGVSMRTLDRALWQFDKEYQGSI